MTGRHLVLVMVVAEALLVEVVGLSIIQLKVLTELAVEAVAEEVMLLVQIL